MPRSQQDLLSNGLTMSLGEQRTRQFNSQLLGAQLPGLSPTNDGWGFPMAITIMNHPGSHQHSWDKPTIPRKMGGWWHCYTHISTKNTFFISILFAVKSGNGSRLSQSTYLNQAPSAADHVKHAGFLTPRNTEDHQHTGLLCVIETQVLRVFTRWNS